MIPRSVSSNLTDILKGLGQDFEHIRKDVSNSYVDTTVWQRLQHHMVHCRSGRNNSFFHKITRAWEEPDCPKCSCRLLDSIYQALHAKFPCHTTKNIFIHHHHQTWHLENFTQVTEICLTFTKIKHNYPIACRPIKQFSSGSQSNCNVANAKQVSQLCCIVQCLVRVWKYIMDIESVYFFL